MLKPSLGIGIAQPTQRPPCSWPPPTRLPGQIRICVNNRQTLLLCRAATGRGRTTDLTDFIRTVKRATVLSMVGEREERLADRRCRQHTLSIVAREIRLHCRTTRWRADASDV
jgi:hypothetical protein